MVRAVAAKRMSWDIMVAVIASESLRGIFYVTELKQSSRSIEGEKM